MLQDPPPPPLGWEDPTVSPSGHLPCPAPRSQGEGTPSYGASEDKPTSGFRAGSRNSGTHLDGGVVLIHEVVLNELDGQGALPHTTSAHYHKLIFRHRSSRDAARGTVVVSCPTC